MFYDEATGELLHICGQGVPGTAEISEYCFPTRGRDDARGQDGGVGWYGFKELSECQRSVPGWDRLSPER